MQDDELDNPIWSALTSDHAHFARGDASVLRYPAEVAPFLGVRGTGTEAHSMLDALVPAGDTVFLLGAAPRVGADWSLKAYPELAQMVCDAPLAAVDGPEIVVLGDAHREDVLALTDLVYPHYYRSRTMEMGRYFGLYVDGRLAAITGERMTTTRATELSAICTHPDFLGRGYARRLMAHLVNDLLAQGRRPSLHVSHENARAKSLYRQVGFRVRRDIGFWSLRRA
jgi:ribosomal protein S18 acetylase RimI-like enzyme